MFGWELLSVAIGGALGSVSRFGLSRWVQTLPSLQNFPWGILLCNVLGCFLIGVFYGVFEHKLTLGPVWRAGIMIGFLGGFTTFSSFSLDTLHLLQSYGAFSALSNVFLNLVVCLLATAVGIWGTLLFVRV